MATKLSLSLADYVITEAGFGADLGAEKFLDIKCRYAGIAPSACVLVATVRALKSHGGVAKADLNQPNLEAVKAGASNLIRHIDNLKNGFGLPVVVAINAFPTDTAEEQAYVEQVCAEQGVPCVLSEVFAKGGEGGKALAEKVLEILEDRPIQYTYPLEMPLKDKINAIATKIYRADGVNYSAAASKTLAELTEMGYGNLPVCIAKTQYSFSDNAKLLAAPTGFTMEVREVRLAAGAGIKYTSLLRFCKHLQGIFLIYSMICTYFKSKLHKTSRNFYTTKNQLRSVFANRPESIENNFQFLSFCA